MFTDHLLLPNRPYLEFVSLTTNDNFINSSCNAFLNINHCIFCIIQKI